MEELSTAPIPGPTRAEDQRRPPAQPRRRHADNRSRNQSLENETGEQDETPDSSEPEHRLDISV